MRLTKNRERILKILEREHQPLSAEIISKELGEDSMNLSTVYRTLDTLHVNRIIGRSIIDHTAYYYLTEGSHHHYMICLKCKKMFEFDCHIHDAFAAIEKTTKFKIIDHDLTLHGYCASCNNA